MYEHYRPSASDCPDGVYRVVGNGDETVTLLRVANADGRRVNTGDVIAVNDAAFEAFVRADNPDGNRPHGEVLVSKLRMGYWSLLAFVRQLAARPLPAAVAAALVVTGAFGDQVLSAPDVVFGGLVLAGSLVLAVVGSGRL